MKGNLLFPYHGEECRGVREDPHLMNSAERTSMGSFMNSLSQKNL